MHFLLQPPSVCIRRRIPLPTRNFNAEAEVHSRRSHSAARLDRTPAVSVQPDPSKASARVWPVLRFHSVRAEVVRSLAVHGFPSLDRPLACKEEALRHSHSDLPLC